MVHTKAVSDLSTGDLAFLRSLGTQAVYDRMAKVQLGGGKCTIACNFCGGCFKSPKAVTAHLLNDCPVAGLRRNGKRGRQGSRRQSGGSRKRSGGADHFYAELRRYEVLTDDQLQRKVYELCGIMVPSGTPRMTMLKILNEFARIYRKDIKKRELQMYLQRLLQEVMQHRHVLPYRGAQNGDEIARLATEVQRLNHLLAECRSKQGECRSGIAFAEVQRGTLEKETGATAGELIKLRGEVRRLDELNQRLQADLKDCQEELTRLKAARDQAIQDVKEAASSAPPDQQRAIAKVAEVLGEETGLKEEIAKRHAKISSLDEQIASTERTLEEKTRALEALVSEITQKTGERDALRQEIAALQRQKASELSAIAAQAEKKSRLDTLVAGLEEKKKRAAELQADIERLTTTRQALESNKESKAVDLDEIDNLRGQLEAVRREKEKAIADLNELPRVKSENERLNGVVRELQKAQADCEQKLAAAERNLAGALANVEAKDHQLAEGQKTLAEIQTLIYWSPENKDRPPLDFLEFPEMTEDAEGNIVRKQVRVNRPKDSNGRPVGLYQKQVELETKLRQLETTREDVERRIKEELIPKIDKLEKEKTKWTEEENKIKWKLAELGQQLFDIHESFEWKSRGKKPLDLLRYARGVSTEMPEAAVRASVTSLLNEFSDYIKFKGSHLSILIKRCNEELQRVRGELARSEEARLKIQGDLDACQRDLANKESAVEQASAKAASEVRRSQEAAAESIGSLRGSMGSELSRLRDQLAEASRKVEECEAAKAELAAKVQEQDSLIRAMQAETKKITAEGATIEDLEERVRILANEIIEENVRANRAGEELRNCEENLAAMKAQLAQNKTVLTQTKEAEAAAVRAKEDALKDLRTYAEDLPAGKSVKDLLARIAELEKALEAKKNIEEKLSQQTQVSEERRRSVENAESQLKTANAGLRAQVEELTAAKVAAEGERDALQEKIGPLQALVDRLSPEIETLKSRLATAEAERDRLASESRRLSQLEESLRSTEQKLSAKTAELQETLSQKSSLEKDLPSLRSTESTLRTEIENLKTDLAAEKKLNEQVAGLRTTLESKEAELAAVKAQLNQRDQEALDALETRVKELTNQLVKQQDECARQLAEAKSNEGQAKARALEEQRDRLTQQWERTNAELESKYKESERRLREQLTALETEAREAKKLAAAAKRELESRPSGSVGQTPIKDLSGVIVPSTEGLDRRIAELESQLAEANAELDSLRLKIGTEMSKSSPDQSVIKETRSNMTFVSDQSARYSTELQETTAFRNSLRRLEDKSPSDLLSDIRKQMERASNAERELAACQEKLAKLEGAKKERRAAVSRVSIATRASQESRSELEKCQGALREKENTLRQKQEELAAVEARAKRVPGLEAEILTLRSKISEVEEKVHNAEEKVRLAEETKDAAFAGVTKSNAELIQEASEARRERDNALLERDATKSELSLEKSKLAGLEAERDKFKKQYDECQEELITARKDRDTAKAEENRLRAELDALREQETTSVPESKIEKLKEIIASLQQQVIDAKTERDAAIAEKEKAESKLTDAIADAKAKGEEVSQVITELQRIQQEHARALGTAKEDADSELDSLREQLKDSKQELDRVRQQLGDCEAAKSGIDAERASAVAELAGLRPQLEEANRQRDAALGEAGKLREKLHVETEKVVAANTERDEVRKTLETDVAEKEATILELQNAQAGIIQDLEEVRGQLKDAKTSMKNLSADKEAAVISRTQLEERIAYLERINNELEAAKEAERQGRESSEARARKARDEAQTGVKSSLANLEQTLRDRDTEISELKKDLATEKAEVRRLGDEESRLNAELSTAQGRIADLATEKANIGSELATAKSSVAAELEQARRDKETAESRASTLEGERDALQSRIDTELNPKIAGLERQLAEKADLSKQGLESLERAKTEAESERDALKRQLDTKTAECDQCQTDLRAANKRVKDLERTLSRQGAGAIDILKEWIFKLRTTVVKVPGEFEKLKAGDRTQGEGEDPTDYEKDRFTNVLKKISELLEEYVRNKSELEALKNTKDSLTEETKRLKNQLQEARDEAKTTEDANVLLATTSGAEIESLTKERDRQMKIVKEKEAEIKQLKEEHKRVLNAAKSAASSEEEKLRRTISELSDKISEVEGKRDAAQQRAIDCEAALAAETSKIGKLESALQKKEQELEGERIKLTEEKSSIEQQVAQLKKNLGLVSQTLTKIKGVTGASALEKADSAVDLYNEIEGKLEACQRELAQLKAVNAGLVEENSRLNGELDAANSRADEAERKLRECEGEKSTQQAELVELRRKEKEAEAARKAEAARLAEEQRQAKLKEERRIKEACERDKSELERLIATLDDQIKEGDKVAEKQWNILKEQNKRDFMTYGQHKSEVIKLKEKESVNCPKDHEEIKNRLSRVRILQDKSARISSIISAALAARKGLELGRDCTKEYETLKELVENYGEERRVLAEKIVKSIDDRIINAKISPELRAIRFKYLSLSGGQVYSETVARTVQGLYARVAEITQDIIRKGSTAIKRYELLYEEIKPYIKPEGVSSIPSHIEAKAKEFASVCKSIDEEIARFKRVEIVDDKTITNDQLINDFEDISGTVRVYVRINDFDVRSDALISTYVRKTADSVDCSRNIQFIPAVCGLPESETKEYRNFYSVFACANNKHLYQGISKVYTKDNPLNCKGKLPQRVPSGVPSPTRCEFTINSSRGLSTTIKQALSGYRIAVFGYGYSGSGKTFTLFGNPESRVDGIVQEAFKDPSIYNRISSLEIPSIVELYGQGTYRGKEDYPKRIIQRGRVRTKIDYINEFGKTLIDKTAVGGILNVVGKKINVNIGSGAEKGKNIAKTIDFINERLTQMRRINGSIKSTPNNPESSRGHLFITFKITTDDGTVGEFIVADFGGIEDPAKIIKYYFPGELKNVVGAIGATYNISLAAIENFLNNLQPHANIQLGTMKNFIQNTTFGKKLNREYNNLKKMYSTSNTRTFVNNDSYTLIGQFKFEGEEATEELIEGLYEKRAIRREPKTVNDILSQVKNANKEFYDNVLVSKALKDFVHKFGLNLEKTQSDMVLLKLRFDSGFRSAMGVGVDQAKIDDGYVKFKLFLAVQIIREGFYINETLNEMKAYFRHQQGIYPNLSVNEVRGNEEKSFELLNDLNSQFRSTVKIPAGIAAKLGAKRSEKGNLLAYNEFATFYRPLFSGESIVSLQKQKGSLLATGIRNIDQVIETVKFERITDFVGARTTDFDPVGMLSMLELINKGPKVREGRRIDVSRGRMQAMSTRFTGAPDVAEIIRPGEEEERREKPSKFVLIALVRPDTEEKEVTVTVLGDGTKQESHSYAKTTKYCDGTKAALDFAEQISSTRITS